MLVDKNWKFASFRFKAGLYFYCDADKNSMYPEDYEKAFGKHEEYKGFTEEIITKNIIL